MVKITLGKKGPKTISDMEIKNWIWSFFPNCIRWKTRKIPIRKLKQLISKVKFEGESTAHMHFLKTKDGRRYIEIRIPKLFLDPEKGGKNAK